MTFEPTIGGRAAAFPDTDRQRIGDIVDDFGEFTAHGVDINGERICEPARRWALLTTDGDLLFLDSDQLGPAPDVDDHAAATDLTETTAKDRSVSDDESEADGAPDVTGSDAAADR